MRLRWAALMAVAGVLMLGGCSSSQTKDNDTPVLQNLYPSNIAAGSAGFTLFIQGSGFISGSTGVSFAYWNGVPLSTNLNNVTGQLEVQVPTSFVATANAVNITVINPGPGGGTSQNPLTFTVVPRLVGLAITSISPTSAAAGGAPFTLTVNGTGFASNDTVTWNGSVRPTTIQPMNTTVATAQITSTDIATAGTAAVAVNLPDLVTATPAASFAVTGPSSPSPKITSLAPSTLAVGSPDTEITLSGSGFAANSAVEWNGSPRASAFINAGELVVLIQAADLKTAATVQVEVTNPAPGGGTSAASTFTIK